MKKIYAFSIYLAAKYPLFDYVESENKQKEAGIGPYCGKVIQQAKASLISKDFQLPTYLLRCEEVIIK